MPNLHNKVRVSILHDFSYIKLQNNTTFYLSYKDIVGQSNPLTNKHKFSPFRHNGLQMSHSKNPPSSSGLTAVDAFIHLSSNGQLTEVILPSGEIILVDGPNRSFLASQQALQEAASLDVKKRFKTRPAQPPRSAATRPIEELFWAVAFHQSGGNLLRHCQRQDVVLFRRWPNLTRVPQTANTSRICALLTRRATSIVLASKILKISEEEIFRVYSAAYYSGISHTVNRAPDVVQPAAHKQASLLGKMMSHLTSRLKDVVSQYVPQTQDTPL
jgi:hypothetical protein